MYFKIVNGAIEINAKRILEEINLEIKDKDHVAIVGRNGAGKTTLLKSLVDTSLLEEGIGEEKFNITILGNPEIRFLKQNEGYHGDLTLLEYILQVYEPLILLEKKMEKLESKMNTGTISVLESYQYVELQETYKNQGGFLYKKEYLTALNKNGFLESDFHKKLSSFSGGEQTKISFIRLLLSKPDLLLLDEPTNHLDIEGIEWLESYLKRYPKAFIVVSHDRMFLNQVVNKIYEIEYGEMILYHGNYEYYEQEKKKRYEINLKNYERQQKEIARLQRIADRFRYKPSKASMALSKLKQIERMVKIAKPEKANTTTFHSNFSQIKASGKVVLTVDHLKFGYQYPLGEITFTLDRGRRLGIIGANGSGKSTFLKTIMNVIPSLGGEFSFGHQVTVAYFDQQFDSLDSSLTVYEEFQKHFPDKTDFEIRSLLASFLFSAEDITKKIEVLSGGEKVRLRLCEVIYEQANFLVLDEPTNHLDILSKEKLESILLDYPGTILFVSHDRYFVKKLADSILEFGSSVTYYDYGYEDYLEKKKEREENILPPFKKEKIKKEGKSKNSLDKQISDLEKKLEELKKELFLEEVYLDVQKYQAVTDKIAVLEKKLEKLLEEWK